MKMQNPGWRFNGNERKYVEEVLSSGFRAGADGAFTARLERKFCEVYGAKYGLIFLAEVPGQGTVGVINVKRTKNK